MTFDKFASIKKDLDNYNTLKDKLAVLAQNNDYIDSDDIDKLLLEFD